MKRSVIRAAPLGRGTFRIALSFPCGLRTTRAEPNTRNRELGAPVLLAKDIRGRISIIRQSRAVYCHLIVT